MKFDGEKTAEENRLRWLRHAEGIGSPALSEPPSSARFAALELNRQAPAPERVETSLALKEAPVADTGRYDSLRQKETDHA